MNDSLSKYKRNIVIAGGASLVFCGLFVFGLMLNGNGAVERYNKLIASDQAGGDVELSLRELRTYIYSHMNSEIGGPNGIYPPIQLSGTYDRLLRAEEEQVETINNNLYAEAQAYCETSGSQSFSGSGRLGCINEYIDTNGVKPQPIDDSLYKFDFVAPRWSPDLAGFSLIFFAGAVLFGVFSLFRYWHMKHFFRS